MSLFFCGQRDARQGLYILDFKSTSLDLPLKAHGFTNSSFKRERVTEKKNFSGFLCCRLLKVSQQVDFVWGQRKGADGGWRWRRTHGDATLECYFFDADGLSLRTSSSTRPLVRNQAAFFGAAFAPHTSLKKKKKKILSLSFFNLGLFHKPFFLLL